jgi:3-isopropylmalate dehydrogenase
MLLRHALKLEDEAGAVEAAIETALGKGLRTTDLAAGGKAVGTDAMASAIAEAI